MHSMAGQNNTKNENITDIKSQQQRANWNTSCTNHIIIKALSSLSFLCIFIPPSVHSFISISLSVAQSQTFLFRYLYLSFRLASPQSMYQWISSILPASVCSCLWLSIFLFLPLIPFSGYIYIAEWTVY